MAFPKNFKGSKLFEREKWGALVVPEHEGIQNHRKFPQDRSLWNPPQGRRYRGGSESAFPGLAPVNKGQGTQGPEGHGMGYRPVSAKPPGLKRHGKGQAGPVAPSERKPGSPAGFLALVYVATGSSRASSRETAAALHGPLRRVVDPRWLSSRATPERLVIPPAT